MKTARQLKDNKHTEICGVKECCMGSALTPCANNITKTLTESFVRISYSNIIKPLCHSSDFFITILYSRGTVRFLYA
jgi:hypothetical protein